MKTQLEMIVLLLKMASHNSNYKRIRATNCTKVLLLSWSIKGCIERNVCVEYVLNRANCTMRRNTELLDS